MHRHHYAAREPDADIRREIERLVRDPHMDRLVGLQARFFERFAYRISGLEKFREGYALDSLARREALRGLGEQRAEVYSHSMVAGGLEEMS